MSPAESDSPEAPEIPQHVRDLAQLTGPGILHVSAQDPLTRKRLVILSAEDAGLLLGMLDRAQHSGVAHVHRLHRIVQALEVVQDSFTSASE